MPLVSTAEKTGLKAMQLGKVTGEKGHEEREEWGGRRGRRSIGTWSCLPEGDAGSRRADLTDTSARVLFFLDAAGVKPDDPPPPSPGSWLDMRVRGEDPWARYLDPWVPIDPWMEQMEKAESHDSRAAARPPPRPRRARDLDLSEPCRDEGVRPAA